MKYLKSLLKVLIYPFIFLVGQFLIQYIFVTIFNSQELKKLHQLYPKLNNNEINNKLNHLITTADYKLRLNDYINSKALIIVLIIAIVFVPMFYRAFVKYKKKDHKDFKLYNILIIILLGMSISLIYNITINNINNFYYFTDNYRLSTISIWIQIISSGVIGPILEELVFRGIVYNKLKEFNKPMKSIILTSIIFSIFHFNSLLNVIYSFAISFILIYVYEKYKSLKAPILLHISANITIILFMYIIVKQIALINYGILILSLTAVIIIYVKIIKKDVYK